MGFVHPILLYIPNLIGYSRIVFTSIAFAVCFSHPITCGFFYGLGQAFDALDGTAARKFNQCSKFGAVLDMLTDRMSTAVLWIVLSHFYPSWWGLFTFLLVLDIVSHWCQMYSSLAQHKTTHKGGDNPLLNFYYTFPYALLVHCMCQELFFTCLYMLNFPSIPPALYQLVTVTAYVTFPVCAMKQFMNLVQLYDACKGILALDDPIPAEPKQNSKSKGTR